MARIAFIESYMPVCCIMSSARTPQYDSAAQIDTPSSSLHTRTCRRSGSFEIGRSNPSLVTMSGTDTTTSTPLALMAERMGGPSSASFIGMRPEDSCGRERTRGPQRDIVPKCGAVARA